MCAGRSAAAGDPPEKRSSESPSRTDGTRDGSRPARGTACAGPACLYLGRLSRTGDI